MRNLILILIVLVFHQCKSPEYAFQIAPTDLNQSEKISHVLVVDVGDLNQLRPTDSPEKKAVLKEIHDRYLAELTAGIEQELLVPVVIDATLKGDDINEALMILMNEKHAEIAFVLRRFEAGFFLDEIVETEVEYGVYSKVANYSAFCSTTLDVFDQSGVVMSRTIERIQPNSVQSVLCGFKSGGPSYKKNAESIRLVAESNINQVVSLLNP